MPLPLAEVLADHWPDYARRHRSRLVTAHYRAVRAVCQCRTPALGGHRYRCNPCNREHYAYHSCNHRSCPQCGGLDQQRWSARQEARLLPGIDYYLITFTVPKELRRFCKRHPKEAYDLLLRESAAALQEVAHTELGARLGFTSVFHSWGRQIQHHPHLHIIVPAAAFDDKSATLHFPDDPEYFLTENRLAARFRNRLEIALKDTERYPGLRTELQRDAPGVFSHRTKWVVDSRHVGRGKRALRYLARYVFKSAFHPNRLLGYEPDGRIKLSWQNSDTARWGVMRLTPDSFLDRFLTHVLPKGFVRVRHYGWLSGAAKRTRQIVRALLDLREELAPVLPPTPTVCCPVCHAPMIRVARLDTLGAIRGTTLTMLLQPQLQTHPGRWPNSARPAAALFLNYWICRSCASRLLPTVASPIFQHPIPPHSGSEPVGLETRRSAEHTPRQIARSLIPQLTGPQIKKQNA